MQRMGDAEGVLGELRRQPAIDRARARGTPMFQPQSPLGCSALNLKRIIAHTAQAASAAAAGPRTTDAKAVDATAVDAGDGVSRPPKAISRLKPSLAPPHAHPASRLAVPVWTIALSLN